MPPSEPTPDLRADEPETPATDDVADVGPEPPPEPSPGDPGSSLDTDPSLRAYLRAQWAALPPTARRVGIALAVALTAWAVWSAWSGRSGGPVPAARQEAQARAEWAAILRQSPEPLGDEVAVATLGPGDAQNPDGRYVDYLVHTRTDSATFSVVVTSADFEPDLSVRRPDGQTVASSNLLRTETRAEIGRLVGPGRFEIAVTTRTRRGEGTYEVSIVPTAAIDSLFVGDEPREDTLGAGARRAGRFERIYGVVGQADQPVVIRVVSPSFVPKLSLLGPSGEVVEGWRSIERRSSGDSLFGVLLRYIPGWDAPYRLLVSSERAGAGGPYVVEAQPIATHALRADGRGLTAALGDASWLVGPRYVDYYRFTARTGTRTTIRAASTELPPALRLWRLERSASRAAGEVLNASGANAVEIAQALDAGEYVLEVTTGGADTLAAIAGAYTVTVSAEALEPPEPRPSAPGEASPRGSSRTFSAGVSRTGASGGSTFEVGVTQVAVSYPAGRTRVQLSVSVRSVDYTGNWAPWTSFVSKGYVVDDEGRRYAPSQAESRSPSGPTAEPGTVRRGTVVFYAPGTLTSQARFVYVASIGENSVTLPISVP